MTFSDKQLLGIGAAVIVGAVVLSRKASAAASAVGTALNPADRGNLINQGVNSVGAILSGNPAFTLGGTLFDTVQGITGSVGSVVEAVNPSSRENLVYRGINSIGSTVSGDPEFTLGGFLYDITH